MEALLLDVQVTDEEMILLFERRYVRTLAQRVAYAISSAWCALCAPRRPPLLARLLYLAPWGACRCGAMDWKKLRGPWLPFCDDGGLLSGTGWTCGACFTTWHRFSYSVGPRWNSDPFPKPPEPPSKACRCGTRDWRLVICGERSWRWTCGGCWQSSHLCG